MSLLRNKLSIHALLVAWIVAWLAGPNFAAQAEDAVPEGVIESITFDADAGKLYAPLNDAATALGWMVVSDAGANLLTLNGKNLDKAHRRRLPDGTELISGEGMTACGAEVNLHPSGQSATIIAGERQFTLMRAEKKVEVSLGEQQLRAWQGRRLVLQTKVSSGKNGRTPAGKFLAGPYKARMHRSSRYHNAPMPWSVQINGPIFIHGFTSVPDYPASHGCVRMPLSGANPARFFYEWVDRGTPVTILPVPPKPKKPQPVRTSLSGLHLLEPPGRREVRS